MRHAVAGREPEKAPLASGRVRVRSPERYGSEYEASDRAARRKLPRPSRRSRCPRSHATRERPPAGERDAHQVVGAGHGVGRRREPARRVGLNSLAWRRGRRWSRRDEFTIRATMPVPTAARALSPPAAATGCGGRPSSRPRPQRRTPVFSGPSWTLGIHSPVSPRHPGSHRTRSRTGCQGVRCRRHPRRPWRTRREPSLRSL